ncbi:MAG TPA: hypothetical protein VFM13_04430 [Gaiellaceae bacterium]|nr:hypothetical protein [Gaiellaceae bacterium]
MKLVIAVTLVALAVHFALTTLALTACGHLRRPLRAGIALTALLVVGLALLAD